MKIAFFHELPFGGARRAVLELGKALRKQHDIDLFYIDDSEERNLGMFKKVFFNKFIPKKWHGNDWKAKLYIDTIELFKIYRLHNKITKEIDSNKYDFVFVHGSKYTQAPFILSMLKTTSVYYCQEPLRIIYEKLFDIPDNLSIERRVCEKINRKIRKIIDRRNIESADILLANSKFTKKNIKKAYNLIAKVCYMGVDDRIFYPENIDRNYDVLFIGSKDQAEGYLLLKNAIKIMNKKPKVRYVLRENEWITDDSVMRKLYSESKIFVSLSYKEPFGLQPIEAQACGTPVIAIKTGGYLETVIDGKTGFLIKNKPQILAHQLLTLINNDESIKILGQNAISNVKNNWTWEKSSKNLLNIIKKYLQNE
ncbi:MAG: glycosyltransferase family 4 protein [Candidatus Levybacteria bacterium]|nr:glycosyltransferase family 4 protein [Candidatus Levybacteria bacterium]